MTVPSAEHLLERAEELASSSGSRRPRQTDLRRAISNAYYAVFHATLTAAADQIAGRGVRASARYALIYRSIDHHALRRVCDDIQKKPIPEKYRKFGLRDGFGPSIVSFAKAVLALQHRRVLADYDPAEYFARSDARLSVSEARTALERFEDALRDEREIFLSFLLFPPRS